MARPFGQIIVQIEEPVGAEDVAFRPESLGYSRRFPEIEQRREAKPHVSPLVSDGRSTQSTAYLAGQNSPGLIQIAVEESQVIDACAKPDVMLMKYGSPLHWRTVKLLARRAVTDFRVDRIRGDRIAHRLAMATRFVFGGEIRIVPAKEKLLEFVHVSASLVGKRQNIEAVDDTIWRPTSKIEITLSPNISRIFNRLETRKRGFGKKRRGVAWHSQAKCLNTRHDPHIPFFA